MELGRVRCPARHRCAGAEGLDRVDTVKGANDENTSSGLAVAWQPRCEFAENTMAQVGGAGVEHTFRGRARGDLRLSAGSAQLGWTQA